MADPYLAVAAFKVRARITDTDQDAAITAALTSASRQIDGWCGRYFGTTESEVRFFTATTRTALTLGDRWFGLDIDDLSTLTEIALHDNAGAYGNVLAAADYELQVADGAGRIGPPFGRIVPTYATGVGFPLGRYGIRVTGLWGWPAPPAPIIEATYLIANRLKTLWDAPFGVAGSGEMGSLQMATSLTPIIKEMLAPYRVLTV